MKRHLRTAVAISAAGLFLGCGSSLVPSTPLDELERNEALWGEAEPEEYRYAIRRLCFCVPDVVRPVRVTVRSGAVVERVYVDDGRPVPSGLADLFPGVDGLFELVRDAIDRDAATLEVRYDPASGVPMEISIDYLLEAVDEELSVDVVEAVLALDP